MRTSKTQIERVFNNICKLTNSTKDNPENQYYLAIDFASCYGGYRLVNVRKESGAHYGAFGKSSTYPRMKASEFLLYLEGIEAGLKFNNNKDILVCS